MRRSGTTIVLLVAPLLVAGCTAYAYRGQVAFEHGHTVPRHDSRYYQRVDRDARGYVDHLDHYLHLGRRQERRIEQLLRERTYDLLDRTPPAEHYSVYPFPRSYGRRTPHSTRRWWDETDRRIEHLLTRRQLREYRQLTRRDSYDDDRYDRRRDRRRGRYDGA